MKGLEREDEGWERQIRKKEKKEARRRRNNNEEQRKLLEISHEGSVKIQENLEKSGDPREPALTTIFRSLNNVKNVKIA